MVDKMDILKKALDNHEVEYGKKYIDDGQNAFEAIYEAMEEYAKVEASRWTSAYLRHLDKKYGK